MVKEEVLYREFLSETTMGGVIVTQTTFPDGDVDIDLEYRGDEFDDRVLVHCFTGPGLGSESASRTIVKIDKLMEALEIMKQAILDVNVQE